MKHGMYQFEVNEVVSTTRGRNNLRFGAQIIHADTGGNSKKFGGPISLGIRLQHLHSIRSDL
jgi:hypothetical protein